MIVVALAACSRASGGGGEDDDKPQPAQVTCRAVEEAQIDDTVALAGVIAPPPKLDSIVSSPIAGRVSAVAIEEGDRVAAGALLAVIEDPALPAGSLEARAAVASAKAAKDAADREVARQEKLVASGIGAKKDLEDARARALAAAAELDAANARAGLASTRMARRELRAPRDGVVLHLWKKVGESVDGTTATPIAEVADVSTLEIHAQATPAALAPLRDGMTGSARVLGVDAPVPVVVARVAPAVDPTTLLGLVRLRVDGGAKEQKLLVGTAASAQIVVAKRAGLRVQASALRRSLVGEDEVVACEGGKAKVHVVGVGARGEGTVEIKSGLEKGARVVIDHVLGLEDDQQIVETAAGSGKGSGSGSGSGSEQR
jgi:RND family efflux transporter MFP subunit